MIVKSTDNFLDCESHIHKALDVFLKGLRDELNQIDSYEIPSTLTKTEHTKAKSYQQGCYDTEKKILNYWDRVLGDRREKI